MTAAGTRLADAPTTPDLLSAFLAFGVSLTEPLGRRNYTPRLGLFNYGWGPPFSKRLQSEAPDKVNRIHASRRRLGVGAIVAAQPDAGARSL